jgi:hypothetical protein
MERIIWPLALTIILPCGIWVRAEGASAWMENFRDSNVCISLTKDMLVVMK